MVGGGVSFIDKLLTRFWREMRVRTARLEGFEPTTPGSEASGMVGLIARSSNNMTDCDLFTACTIRCEQIR